MSAVTRTCAEGHDALSYSWPEVPLCPACEMRVAEKLERETYGQQLGTQREKARSRVEDLTEEIRSLLNRIEEEME